MCIDLNPPHMRAGLLTHLHTVVEMSLSPVFRKTGSWQVTDSKGRIWEKEKNGDWALAAAGTGEWKG